METSLVINIVLLAAFFSKAAALTAPTSYSGGCGNSVFTDGSTYQSNLADLLSVLNSTKISDQLTALSSYVGEEGINRVYGQFLCTPGYSPDVCQDCLTYAASDILKKCHNVKFAVAWYDQCLLRYSDQSNFPSIYLHSTTNVYSVSQERFNETVTTTLSELAREAATRPTWGSTKFAVRESNLSSDKLYTLVQCTVDNSTDNCSACLQDAFSHLPGLVDYVGGRALLTSCLFRFETYPFFNASGTSAVGSSPVSPPKPGTAIKGTSHGTIIGVTAGSLSIFLAASILVIYYFKSIRTRRRTSILQEGQDMIGIQIEDSLQFDLSTIRAATKDFSEDNKLGRGGFGEVHKGILGDGKEIAVKRLSGCSSQGGEEFKNEVMVVAKLQHRNLARLIGFCLEGDEKILIYEFVPNKSLDYFLFDNEKRGQLNWSKRFNIIRGTARGIMYLHEESRLRIIHRDLKSSNILLDEQLNPKISDFGMARIFEADQAQASTDRIVGTYGYMSPEYAMRGEFSIKSDVYSFGVLLLEIIHGRRNNSFYQVDDFVDLVNYVWKHWTDEKSFEVVDPVLASTCTMEEVVRVIHIGLLCVQEDPRPRPTMTLVTMMLNGFPSILPSPKKPGFLPGRRVHGEGSETENKKGSTLWSVDEALITEPHPR